MKAFGSHQFAPIDDMSVTCDPKMNKKFIMSYPFLLIKNVSRYNMQPMNIVPLVECIKIIESLIVNSRGRQGVQTSLIEKQRL